MKALLACSIGLLLVEGVATAQVRGVDVGVSVADGRLRSFYLAIGDYYGVPPPQVVELHDRCRCPDEDLPVVYFLAARAHVEPAAIISLRVQKMPWLDIAFHYHLTPDIFFVPVSTSHIGPPYGHAYGYYRKYGPSRDWKKITITDHDVVNLVNLRFVSEHYKMSPEAVMTMRGRESKFVVINDEVQKSHQKAKSDKQKQKGNGKDKKK
jgi:hypothetical protein